MTKVTKAQLEKRLQRAVLHIDRDRDYQAVYFSDKGLRLEVTKDYCVVSTMAHSHVFHYLTGAGEVSRPYLYTKRFIELAHELKPIMEDKDGGYYSYTLLMELLKKDDDRKDDYAIAFFCDMWFFAIFQNLYIIGEWDSASFITYLSYVCGITRNYILLDEHKEDMTNHEFVNLFVKKIKELTGELEEQVIIKKKTDEELNKENAIALEEVMIGSALGVEEEPADNVAVESTEEEPIEATEVQDDTDNETE